MFAPLRRVEREEVTHDSPLDGIRARRELVYTAIRDLDHDFETAKLEEDDYTQMRDRLRSEAIELLRAEREASAQEALATEHSDTPGGSSVAAASEPTTGAYCPTCGKAVTANWRFCSHCGGNLNPTREAGR